MNSSVITLQAAYTILYSGTGTMNYYNKSAQVNSEANIHKMWKVLVEEEMLSNALPRLNIITIVMGKIWNCHTPPLRYILRMGILTK
jgi:serine/threonine protein kinase HipA of HipAB toxin-antitoxin module